MQAFKASGTIALVVQRCRRAKLQTDEDTDTWATLMKFYVLGNGDEHENYYVFVGFRVCFRGGRNRMGVIWGLSSAWRVQGHFRTRNHTKNWAMHAVLGPAAPFCSLGLKAKGVTRVPRFFDGPYDVGL